MTRITLCAAAAAALAAAPVREMIGEIARRGIPIDPTLVAYDTRFAAPDGGRYRANRYDGVVPEMLSDWIACTRTRTGRPTTTVDGRAPATRRLRRPDRCDEPRVIRGSLHQEFELLRTPG